MKIYLIGDLKYSFERTKEVIESGVDLFQLRVKDIDKNKIIQEALRYKDVCEKNGVTFIINDYVEIAKRVDANGLHLGQDDMSLSEAKKEFGKIIGVSCRSIEEAKRAKDGGASYIGVGAVYPTKTKENAKVIGLEGLKQIKEAVDIDIVAIGGIDERNFKDIEKLGIDCIAISSALLEKENPKKIINTIKGGK
jgi:thiamine-phosphate diphosphorylase